jgi:hypothetical protein
MRHYLQAYLLGAMYIRCDSSVYANLKCGKRIPFSFRNLKVVLDRISPFGLVVVLSDFLVGRTRRTQAPEIIHERVLRVKTDVGSAALSSIWREEWPNIYLLTEDPVTKIFRYLRCLLTSVSWRD